MTLHDIPTPSAVLDADIFERNCERMKGRAAGLGVALRPHLKTGKCLQMALRQMTSPQGPATVSTLREAEVFFAHGVTDLTCAVGITPSKLPRCKALIDAGCDLKVILDNAAAAKAVSAFCAREGVSVPVLIEIDSDGHRSGVRADSSLLPEVASCLGGGARLAGVLTHAGDSYKCQGAACCIEAAENERAMAVLAAERLRAAGYAVPIVSMGSTPTAVFARSLQGVTELRCGVYSTFDLVMAGIGACGVEDIALSLLVEVIGHQPEKGWIITDGGWMALSRDRGTASQAEDQGYGLVCDIEGRLLDGLLVIAANQEHGIIARRDGGAADISRFPVGSRLRILPNHACAMGGQHPFYRVVRLGVEVTDTWERFGGWYEL